MRTPKREALRVLERIGRATKRLLSSFVLFCVWAWLGQSWAQIPQIPKLPPKLAPKLAPKDRSDSPAKSSKAGQATKPPSPRKGTRSCDELEALAPEQSIVQWVANLRHELDPSTPCQLHESVHGIEIRSRYVGHDLSKWLDHATAFVEDNPVILTLSSPGRGRVEVRASLNKYGQHGIRWVGQSKVPVTGSTRPGDTLKRLQQLLLLDKIDPKQGLYEAGLQEILQILGYVGHWSWTPAGKLTLVVRPGHLIRKIKVRGNFPVKSRDVLAQIPAQARPGRLSPMRCFSGEEHKDLLSCADGDMRCEHWRQEVQARVETLFIERGYLKAHVELRLTCDSNTRDATLKITVSKNGLYRVDPKRIRFVGEARSLPDSVKRHIRRELAGIALPGNDSILSSPATQMRMDSIAAKLRRELSEPGRAFGNYFRPGQRPYPSARLKIMLNLREPPKKRRLGVDIHAQLGPPLTTHFHAPPGASKPLMYRHAQLQRQLQLFSREESPSQVIAASEAANLRAFYQSRGYPMVSVKGHFTDFSTLQRLSFVIDEGPQARIRELTLAPAKGVPFALSRKIEKTWQRERALGNRSAFSDAKALEDLGRLTEAYRAQGYPCATARLRLAFWPEGLDTPGAHATLDASRLLQGGGTPGWLSDFNQDGLEGIGALRRARLYLRYEVQPGPRLLASQTPALHYLARPPRLEPAYQIPTRAQGQWGAKRILYKSSLNPETDSSTPLPVSGELQRNAAVEIMRKYNAAGYPLAHASVYWGIRASSSEDWTFIRELRELADPQTGICHSQADVKSLQARPEIFVYEGQRGKFGDTVFRGNFKTRTKALERELRYKPGDRYDIDRFEDSLRGIETLGILNRLEVTPMPRDCEEDSDGDCVVHHAIEVQEAADYFMDLRYGVGAATLNPLYFFVQPTIPNIAGTGWRLAMDLSYGLDVVDNSADSRLAICGGADCYERRASASLSRVHLPGLKVGVNLSTQYQVRKTPARGFISTINASARLTWRLRGGRSFYTGYRFQRANLSEDIVKPLGGSKGAWVNRSLATVRDNTGMVEGGFQIQNVDNPFNPRQGYIANADLAVASRVLGGGDHWAKIDLSWQHFVPLLFLSERWQFRYALRYGQIFPFIWAGTVTAPKIWRYYGGGSFDLGLRGMRPETMLLDLERIPTPAGGAVLRAKAQGGHLRLLSTLALEFVSVRDLFGGNLSHSIFYDSGYLLQSFAGADLARDYRHSIGLNFLKLDINLATLAFGYALLLPPNVTEYDDRNGRFVFDVGITF